MFEWRQPDDPEHLGSLNYRVDDLDAMMAKLQAEGIHIGPERSVDENGTVCVD